jgi:hypothetical protein
METIKVNIEPIITLDKSTGVFGLTFPVIKTDGTVRVEPTAINLSATDIEKKLSDALNVEEIRELQEAPIENPVAEEPIKDTSELVEEELQEENKEEKENVSTDSESDTTGDSTED